MNFSLLRQGVEESGIFLQHDAATACVEAMLPPREPWGRHIKHFRAKLWKAAFCFSGIRRFPFSWRNILAWKIAVGLRITKKNAEFL